MATVAATIMATIGTSNNKNNNSDSNNDSLKVKMVKDARRKQQWVETLTPPRSPTTDLLDSEPIIDDLWELWTGAGLHEISQDHACTIDNALSELGFTTDDDDVKPFGDPNNTQKNSNKQLSISDFDEDALFNNENGLYGDAEELLDHLFQFVENDSPPPTNPPSPPGPGDSETDPLEHQSYNHAYVNYTNSNGSISSSSSTNGDVEDSTNQQYEDAFASDGSSGEGSPLYDEGMIGEDLINEQPSIFDTNFSLLDPKFNIFDDDFGKDIKHDCMWNGECCSSTGKPEHTVNQGTTLKSTSPTSDSDEVKFEFSMSKIKIEREEPTIEKSIKDEPIRSDAQDDEMSWSNDPFNMYKETPSKSDAQSPTKPDCFNGLDWKDVLRDPDSPPHNNPDCFNNLDWTDLIDERTPQETAEYLEELECRRIAAINDHSYANLSMQDAKTFSKPEAPKRGIQAIVLPEENGDDYSGGPKKTKILVPLKDLMDSLQHKTFLVAPLGPGKKVIRLTGSETVKGMLGVHHQALTSSTLKSVSSYCVPQQSLYSRSSSSHASPPSSQSRHKKSKVTKTILREGGTITFPNQQSPASPTSSCSSTNYSSSSNSNSSSTNSSGRPKKTKTHNNMERMRRIDLRNSFDSLKKLVPPLSKSAKCSKVEILRRAEEYIRALKSLEKRLVREEAAVRARNEQLKSKLLHSQSS